VVGIPAGDDGTFGGRTTFGRKLFAGVPQSILYWTTTKIAWLAFLAMGKRQRTRGFAELESHYLFRESDGLVGLQGQRQGPK